MKRMPIILIGILFISMFFYFDNKRQKVIDKVALEDLNLQLVGVVDSVDYANNGHYHGYGIILLKIIRSNIQEYDPSTTQKFYYCLIKNGEVEIYDHASQTFKGDTLTIDTKSKIKSWIRNGKKEEQGSISINTNDDYNNYIRRHHILMPLRVFNK